MAPLRTPLADELGHSEGWSSSPVEEADSTPRPGPQGPQVPSPLHHGTQETLTCAQGNVWAKDHSTALCLEHHRSRRMRWALFTYVRHRSPGIVCHLRLLVQPLCCCLAESLVQLLVQESLLATEALPRFSSCSRPLCAVPWLRLSAGGSPARLFCWYVQLLQGLMVPCTQCSPVPARTQHTWVLPRADQCRAGCFGHMPGQLASVQLAQSQAQVSHVWLDGTGECNQQQRLDTTQIFALSSPDGTGDVSQAVRSRKARRH